MRADFEIILTIKPGFFKKKIGVRFDMLCFFVMLDEFGISLEDDMSAISKIPIDELLSVGTYAGIKSYAFHYNKPNAVSKDTVIKWIDDSIITRKQFRDISLLWMEFMQTFEDKKKQKAKV